MSRTKFLTYLSPAKLNLGLKVTGKSANGYHSLKTIFCLIDLFDQIDIQVTYDGKISLIEHNQIWHYQKDLTYKAAKLFQHITKCSLGVNIRVKKAIPSGSGLGGGSSNAATVLIVLNQLWQINMELHQLIKIGQELGSDIPFFIFGKNAIATGIGEKLTVLELPEQYFVLINPEFHISTQEIFTNYNLDMDKINPDNITTDYLLNTKDNDLEGVAIKLYPELKTIINDLKIYGNVAMTGSGSTIYLSYADKSTAKKVATELQSLYNVYFVKSLLQSPLYSVNF